MNRKTFFKRLTIGAAAVVVSPKILAAVKPTGILTVPEMSEEERNLFMTEWKNFNGRVVYKTPDGGWWWHLSDLCTGLVPDFGCVKIGDVVLADVENIHLRPDDVTPFLNHLHMAYNKRADELGCTNVRLFDLEISRFYEFK